MDLFGDEDNFDMDPLDRLDQLENEIRAEINMEIELGVVRFDEQLLERMDVGGPDDINLQGDQEPAAPLAQQPPVIPPNPEPRDPLEAAEAAIRRARQQLEDIQRANEPAPPPPVEKKEEPEASTPVKEEEDPILTPKGSEMKGFSCMICYDPFNTTKRIPKVFPCGHTFCLSCVQGLMRNRTFLSSSTVICPTCRQNSRYSMTLGADKVPTNFCILAMLEQRKEEKEPKAEQYLCQCRECRTDRACTELTICNEESCQDVMDEEVLKDVDAIKRSKCLLICRTCIENNHPRHNIIPFEKVVAQFEVNERVCAAETALEKVLRSCDDTLQSMKLTEQEVVEHRRRMKKALENIRSEAHHPQIYEYLTRYTESIEASDGLFRNLIGDLSMFDFKSKARYYRAFGTDMLRPISIVQKGPVVLKEEPRDDAPAAAAPRRAANRPPRVARFNVIGPFAAARNPVGGNPADLQFPPLPDIGNMMNRLMQQLDAGQANLLAPFPALPEMPGVDFAGAAGAAAGAAAGMADAMQVIRDRHAALADRMNVWALRAPVVPRRRRGVDNANVRAVRQNLIAALAANPVLQDIPAIQQAIDGLQERPPPEPAADPAGLGQGIARAEQDLIRLRERLNRLEALNANNLERNRELMGIVAPPPPPQWVDQIIDEPLAQLPPIHGVDPEVVQRAEIVELVTRIINMVRNEANVEAVANNHPLPDRIDLPNLLNADAIPGVPDYNHLRPEQVVPFLADLRALELEWIQRARDRRARAAAPVAADPAVPPPVAEPAGPAAPAEPAAPEQAVPAEPAAQPQVPAPPVAENVGHNRDLPPRPLTPVPDEPAAKRNRI